MVEGNEQSLLFSDSRDPANIQSKHQKHQAFEAELAANAERIQTVLAAGQNLIDKRQCADSEEAVQVGLTPSIHFLSHFSTLWTSMDLDNFKRFKKEEKFVGQRPKKWGKKLAENIRQNVSKKRGEKWIDKWSLKTPKHWVEKLTENHEKLVEITKKN